MPLRYSTKLQSPAPVRLFKPNIETNEVGRESKQKANKDKYA